jgi:hypothetical protein
MASMESIIKSEPKRTEEPIQKAMPSYMGLSHPWGTMPRIGGYHKEKVEQSIQKAVAPTPAPAPTQTKEVLWGCPAPLGYQRRQDISGMTGAQLVAMKAGLDVNTPGIEKMSFEEMKELAAKLSREETRRQYRKLYGMPDTVDPLPDRVERPINIAIPSY